MKDLNVKNLNIKNFDLKSNAKTIKFVVASLACTTVLFGSVASANVKTTNSVNLIVNGTNNYCQTAEKTVGDFLASTDVEINDSAVINVDEDEEITDNMNIVVVQDEVRTVEYKELIGYNTEVEYSDELAQGSSQVKVKGIDGEKTITITTKYDGGKAEKPTTSEKITLEPVNQVVVVGTKKQVVPETSYEYSEVVTMNASAYAPVVECCGKDDGITANGSYAGKGVVAVDPNVIPLGTKLYVPGYGICIAADTGGAIKGNKIDLCYNTYNEALNFGRKDVSVYILK
jgi:3D (Asp-Asp-Asp) domain-containing protein